MLYRHTQTNICNFLIMVHAIPNLVMSSGKFFEEVINLSRRSSNPTPYSFAFRSCAKLGSV